jgi:hypothetical protein
MLTSTDGMKLLGHLATDRRVTELIDNQYRGLQAAAELALETAGDWAAARVFYSSWSGSELLAPRYSAS